jgi:hypothetical protein
MLAIKVKEPLLLLIDPVDDITRLPHVALVPAPPTPLEPQVPLLASLKP